MLVDHDVEADLVAQRGQQFRPEGRSWDLRRTYMTVAENTDISALALKAVVNHSLGDDVTAGYVQMTVDRLRDPAQRVADRLKERCGIGVTANVTEAPRPADVAE